MEIIQIVEVWDDEGDPIVELCGKKYFNKEGLVDEFNTPRTHGTAKVRRELAETIGGPGYSSVRVSTSIEIECDRDKEVVRSVAQNIMAECSLLNEEAVLDAFQGLLAHRSTLGLKKE